MRLVFSLKDGEKSYLVTLGQHKEKFSVNSAP